jgi:hypothetical protein
LYGTYINEDSGQFYNGQYGQVFGVPEEEVDMAAIYIDYASVEPETQDGLVGFLVLVIVIALLQAGCVYCVNVSKPSQSPENWDEYGEVYAQEG